MDERSHAERVLELDRVLEMVGERCSTSLGMEFARGLRPSFERERVAKLVAQTEEAFRLSKSSEPPVYSGARDVRAFVASAGKGSWIPGDEIFRVGETIEAMNGLRRYLAGKREEVREMWSIAERLPYLAELQKELHSSISPEGEVLDSASPALKKIRSEKNAQARRLSARIQNLINGELKSYLQEPIYTIRDGRYVVPVKFQYRGKVPGIVHDASGSGQTIFVEPEALVGEANRLRELEAEEKEEVERVLRELSKKIGLHADEILAGMDSLAEIDCLFAKARFAIDRNCVVPKLVDGYQIRIVGGHHPLIDPSVSVGVDVFVGENGKSLLITGPNTGGKTVTLKMIGLFALMIGCGILPPAMSVEYGVFGKVWADIGDEQSLQQSLSTFSGHLRNVAKIFKDAKEGDLALLDEIGAGTDPKEGAALGQAFLETLANTGVVVAASTHYGELKQYAQGHEKYYCAAMEFDVATLRPTYRLIPGASGQSHALEISRRHGIPDEVVDLAEKAMGEEAMGERAKSTEIDRLLAEARAARTEALELKREAEAGLAKLESERNRELEKLRKARARAEDTVNEALREAREKYRELLAAIRQMPSKEKEEILEQAREIEKQIQGVKSSLAPEPLSTQPIAYEPGMTVRLLSNNHVGRVIEVQKSGKLLVSVGALRLSVLPSEVIPDEERRSHTFQRTRGMSMERAMTAKTELNLRHLRAEEAIEKLDKFFDEVVLAGLPQVRIVHGKGNGVLRKIVHDFLSQRSSEVERFRLGEPGEGGTGVTVVYMK